jgi:hypothetical protein
MKIQIQVEGAAPEELKIYSEIMEALIKTGGLSGMKNGSTNIHFDASGNFMGIRFDYWPWRRRKDC